MADEMYLLIIVCANIVAMLSVWPKEKSFFTNRIKDKSQKIKVNIVVAKKGEKLKQIYLYNTRMFIMFLYTVSTIIKYTPTYFFIKGFLFLENIIQSKQIYYQFQHHLNTLIKNMNMLLSALPA